VNDGAAYRADADIVTRKLWGHFARHNTGVSILKTNGVYVQQQYVYHDDIVAADIFYQGGHVYDVSIEEAEDLLAAGYEVEPATTTLTIYGADADVIALDPLFETSTGHTVSYVSVPGMEVELGAVLFGCAVHDGLVYIGNLAASGNSLNGSYVTPEVHVFNPDPTILSWTNVPLVTSTGASGVVGSDGWGRGDILSFTVAGGRVVGLTYVDYSDWVIGTYGRYPAFLIFNGATLSASSKTIPELRAAAADGNGALSWPDETNSHAETYASNRGMADQAVLPNGEIVVADYFPPTGAYSGRVKVLNSDGVERAFYQFADMTAHDTTTLTVCPKFVNADPSHTTVTDLRFVVSLDVFARGTSTNRPHALIEMAYNANTGAITPVCAPVIATTSDQTAFATYEGLIAAAIYDDAGTCWVGTGSLAGFGFAQKPMGGWIATAGERRWAADNPAGVGWELDVGAVRCVPDFELAVVGQASSLLSGLTVDPDSGGIVDIGFSGRVWPFLPDSPMALRTSIVSNSLYAANVTGWTSFGLTGTTTWDAGDSGRLKFTANGSSTSAVWQSDSAGVYQPLPADPEGQSLCATTRVKAAATARRAQVQVQFFDDDNLQVGLTLSGPWADTNTSTYTKVSCPVVVPATATQFKMLVIVNRASGGNIPNNEIHYSDEAYLALAPVTHLDEMNMDLSLLPLGVADRVWPAGLGNQFDIDEEGNWFVPIRSPSSSLDGVALPPYVARISLPALLTPGIR
jgi:hypothetical protein